VAQADDGDRRFSWYEPLTDPDRHPSSGPLVLGEDDLFLNTTSDARLLPLVIEAASRPDRRAEHAEMDADTERFGITPLFDGTELERI
jgi:hypothetical protein